MKNSKAKTKAVAGVVVLAIIGAVTVMATSVVAGGLLDDDVPVVVASSRNYEDSASPSNNSNNSKHEEKESRGDDFEDYESYDETGTVKVTLEEAIKIATADTPGRVIEVEFERGRYEVKIRTKDGHKKEINISAKDGAIVRRK
ncbi:hypothetical protein MNBD_DELTA01-1993 [hydrothermal vent metagenome]|uniref:PepSY domain-containing protein n=1 Tax=hydrothermal vent metagenome TaxID=652676 RepID=A0A3B0RE28_9ZZZZ